MYADEVRALSPLETFDARVFIADDHYSKDLCDFVLSLAVAFNDLRDVLYAHVMLDDVTPDDKTTPTPELGLYNGLTTSVVKMKAGVLHELLVLIEKERDLTPQHRPQPFRRGWGLFGPEESVAAGRR